ncbi:hypothetical protein BG004_001893 [Podila humilis]|nr:hypothetical protein BG004_001893 [Podila humilis]
MWFRDLEFEIQSIRLNDRGGRGGGLGDIQDVDAGTINKISPVTGSRNVSQMNTDHYLALCRSTSRINPVFDPSSRMGRNVDAAIEYNGQQVMNSQDTYQGQGQEQVLGDLPPSASVTVRWTLKGTTRPSVVLTLSGPTSPPPSTFSGVFVYEFDDRGLVNEHRIENIMPSPSREAIDRAFAWWGWLLSRTRPTAAAASEVDASRKRLGLGCFQTK